VPSSRGTPGRQLTRPPPAQVIAFVCVLVWLINYHHFLTWRWRGFKKLADPFFVPDPSTIHVDLGPMVSCLESAQDPVAPAYTACELRLLHEAQFFIRDVDGCAISVSVLTR
jgi:hypothetical protein